MSAVERSHADALASRISLGSAQFGLDYGVSNKAGQTPAAEVRRVLDLAWDAGVRQVDTAPIYGDSEGVLGRSWPVGSTFKVTTKIPALALSGARRDVAAGVEASLEALRVPKLHGLIAHDASDLLGEQGAALFSEMVELRDRGLVDRVGASVYDPADAIELATQHEVDLVQLPLSILDQRALRGDVLPKLKAGGVEVHVRSVFLQGALFMEPRELGAVSASLASSVAELHHDLAQRGLSILEASLGFVLGIDEVDAAIVGVTRAGQLEEVLGAAAPLSAVDFTAHASSDVAALDPRMWPARGRND
jgi:aryl-alcohol dehydrogenase-like predicted oxidoreductase